MMELRIWQYGTDDHYITSFLDGMSVAHKQPAKSIDWFHWKFEQSPYGKAILACAFDNGRVAGCVAYGKGVIKYHGKDYDCALSYETFVHPDFQGHGLFKKLIDLAESEAVSQKISFLYNFPNANSITGFKHMGWICRNDIEQYRIKIAHPIRFIGRFIDIKKGFVPNPSNLNVIKKINIDDVGVENANQKVIVPVWTSDYLKWRFFTFPNREYFVLNNSAVFAISMIGKRGNLIEAHILYIVSKHNDVPTCKLTKQVVKEIKKTVKPDFISYSNSIGDDVLSCTIGFIKVPSHSNFCFKILDEGLTISDFSMSIPAINAHTY